jgi:hypothetical protein
VSSIYPPEAARDGRRRGKVTPFDRGTSLDQTDCDWVTTERAREALDVVEVAYIRRYRPPYNIKGLQ